MVCLGTRPEAIKLAPVIKTLGSHPRLSVLTAATGQHREMLDQMLGYFEIEPDIDLDLMTHRQGLAELAAGALQGVSEAIAEHTPAAVVVQGDTNTAFAAALAAFYAGVPVAHVEAGLRTGNPRLPFPEEINRRLVAPLAQWHFCPTAATAANLLNEGLPASAVKVTGNTVIDALLGVAGERPRPAGPPRRVLVTAHRRENFGAPIRSICAGLAQALEAVPDLTLLWPVHPNPSVAEVVREAFGGHPRVTLTEPLGYGDFVRAMAAADFIVSDSGGVQEEAPALGKPVLVLREETERPEAVELGLSRLIGSDTDRVAAEVRRLACDPEAFAAMARGGSPYGDGKAAIRIADALVERFGGAPLAPGARAG
jgi:UDP-N-acetylglucosamine 2-epimerase (non-hydrolysing)